jgi:hypothetical protein
MYMSNNKGINLLSHSQNGLSSSSDSAHTSIEGKSNSNGSSGNSGSSTSYDDSYNLSLNTHSGGSLGITLPPAFSPSSSLVGKSVGSALSPRSLHSQSQQSASAVYSYGATGSGYYDLQSSRSSTDTNTNTNTNTNTSSAGGNEASFLDSADSATPGQFLSSSAAPFDMGGIGLTSSSTPLGSSSSSGGTNTSTSAGTDVCILSFAHCSSLILVHCCCSLFLLIRAHPFSRLFMFTHELQSLYNRSVTAARLLWNRCAIAAQLLQSRCAIAVLLLCYR